MKPLSYKTVADIRLRGLTSWEVVERYRDTEYYDVVFGGEKNLSRKNDKAHILFGYSGKRQKHLLGAFVKRYERREQAGWHYRYHVPSYGSLPFFEQGDFGFFPWSFEWNVIEAMILRGVWYRIGILDGLHMRVSTDSLPDEPEESVKRIGDQPACWLIGPRKDCQVLFVDKHTKENYAVFSVTKDSLNGGTPTKKLFSDPKLPMVRLAPYMQILLDEYAEKHSLSRYEFLTHKQILGLLKKGKGKCQHHTNPYQHVLQG